MPGSLRHRSNDSPLDQGFDGLRISVWTLNRMMECVANHLNVAGLYCTFDC